MPVIMEISSLSMEERLELWKQRKNNGKSMSSGSRNVKSKSLCLEDTNSKLVRKRNRKYINSAMSSSAPTTPHTKHNPTASKSFEIQKRTKKENDDPNLKEHDTSEQVEKDSDRRLSGVSGIASDMQSLQIDSPGTASVLPPRSMYCLLKSKSLQVSTVTLH